jgi:hypothetical protein
MRTAALAALMLTAAPAWAFEPGTHGEPVEETGYFVGCFTGEEGGSGCELHARGAIWIVSSEGPTEPFVMNAMVEMVQGAPVRFTGDMISMGDVTVDFALNTIEANPDDPLAPLVADLQGEWQGAGGAVVTVTGLEWAEADGRAYLISLGTACSDGAERGTTHISLYEMGGDPFQSICLKVDSHAPDKVELSGADGGEALVLTR